MEGDAFITCMFRVEFGHDKAQSLLDTWTSGYKSEEVKKAKQRSLNHVMEFASQAIDSRQCRHWVVMSTRYAHFPIPDVKTLDKELEPMRKKLGKEKNALTAIAPALESVQIRCLKRASLNEEEKERIADLIGTGSAFKHELTGGVMPEVLGRIECGNLLRIIAHGINQAKYLEDIEIEKRLTLLLAGYRQGYLCQRAKTDQECIELVDAGAAEDSLITPAFNHILHSASPHVGDNPLAAMPSLHFHGKGTENFETALSNNHQSHNGGKFNEASDDNTNKTFQVELLKDLDTELSHVRPESLVGIPTTQNREPEDQATEDELPLNQLKLPAMGTTPELQLQNYLKDDKLILKDDKQDDKQNPQDDKQVALPAGYASFESKDTPSVDEKQEGSQTGGAQEPIHVYQSADGTSMVYPGGKAPQNFYNHPELKPGDKSEHEVEAVSMMNPHGAGHGAADFVSPVGAPWEVTDLEQKGAESHSTTHVNMHGYETVQDQRGGPPINVDLESESVDNKKEGGSLVDEKEDNEGSQASDQSESVDQQEKMKVDTITHDLLAEDETIKNDGAVIETIHHSIEKENPGPTEQFVASDDDEKEEKEDNDDNEDTEDKKDSQLMIEDESGNPVKLPAETVRNLLNAESEMDKNTPTEQLMQELGNKRHSLHNQHHGKRKHTKRKYKWKKMKIAKKS